METWHWCKFWAKSRNAFWFFYKKSPHKTTKVILPWKNKSRILNKSAQVCIFWKLRTVEKWLVIAFFSKSYLHITFWIYFKYAVPEKCTNCFLNKFKKINSRDPGCVSILKNLQWWQICKFLKHGLYRWLS